MAIKPPFTVAYSMFTGTIRRQADTAVIALVDERALRQAGAANIEIRDRNGSQVSVDDLKKLVGQ